VIESLALLAQAEEAPPDAIRTLAVSPLFWVLLLAACGIWLMIIGARPWQRRTGIGLGAVALCLLIGSTVYTHSDRLPTGWEAVSEQVIFWLLAALTIVSAAAVITMRSPVYSAVWFALTLLCVSGLLFVQGAQFLGVATMAVYAGAILVTFLFVLMLAQPEGHAYYDRLSWGHAPAAVAVAASLTLAVGATYLIVGQRPLTGGEIQGGLQPTLRDRLADALPTEVSTDHVMLREHLLATRFVRPDGRDVDLLVVDAAVPADLPAEDVADWEATAAAQLVPTVAGLLDLNPATFDVVVSTRENVRARQHVARLGGNLFSRHLISIQAAGALLLAALVGAVAIAMGGRQSRLGGEGGEHA